MNSRTANRLATVCCWVFFFGPAVLPGQEAPPATQEAAAAALEEGRTLLADGDLKGALVRLQHADRLAGGSPEAQIELARTYQLLGAFKDMAKAARSAAAASQDSGVLIDANSLLALALTTQAEKTTSAKEATAALTEAEAALRLVMSQPRFPFEAQFNLGHVQLRLGKDAEGVEQLKQFLAVSPKSELAARAKSLIENPRRAREALLPDFALATLSGELLTSESLAGKVVLFDFWATWCEPCHAALPGLRNLWDTWKREPLFALVSASHDSEEGRVAPFVERERMHWTNVWDGNQELSRLLAVPNRLPAYVLVDHEGKVIHVTTGYHSEFEAELMGEVRRAISKARKAAKKGS